MAGTIESNSSAILGNGAPHHGDQGQYDPSDRFVPPALTIAISRETGARGGTIGKHVSKRLGWAFYDQELLQYLAQKEGPSDVSVSGFSVEAQLWIDDQLERLQEEGRIGKDAKERAIARVIFSIAAKGRAVIVGRGAGAMLPARLILHVRIVAPLSDRIIWIRQLHRLTADQAAEFIQRQDRRRSNVLDTHFRRPSKDASLYDLVLNSSQLGELSCEQLIAVAVEQKQALTVGSQGPSPGISVETLE